jgi:hypothetical protein
MRWTGRADGIQLPTQRRKVRLRTSRGVWRSPTLRIAFMSTPSIQAVCDSSDDGR